MTWCNFLGCWLCTDGLCPAKRNGDTQQSILMFYLFKCSFGHILVSSPLWSSVKRKTHYLPEKDVAVCAEVQGVTVLLSVRIAAAQLEVHLLPLQLTLIWHHQALSDLKKRDTDFRTWPEERKILWNIYFDNSAQLSWEFLLNPNSPFQTK